MIRSVLRSTLVVAALLAGVAGQASAQEALWERVRATFDAATQARIGSAVEAAASRGVPAEPILEKALEGAAKGVPAARILPAVEEYAGRLGRASGLLPSPASRAGLVAAADALRRGVPPDMVGEVARAHPADAPASLVVLGDLIEAGVPVEHARDAVAHALAGGRGTDELLDLPAVVRRRIREGHDPGEAARGAAAGRGRGLGPPAGVGPTGGVPGKPPVPPGSKGPTGNRGGGRGATGGTGGGNAGGAM